MVEEDLLLRHPIDCPICDKAGECTLQDYHFRYGQAARRTDVMPFTSRKRDLGDVDAVHRPLRDVLALRAVLRRRQRHGRVDGHQPRRPRGDRRRARLPAAQRAFGQRGRSLPGRGAGRQGLPLSAAGMVHAAAQERLHRLLGRLLDLGRGEPGPGLPPQAARESARQQVVDLQRRPLRLPPRPRPEATGRARGFAKTARRSI